MARETRERHRDLARARAEFDVWNAKVDNLIPRARRAVGDRRAVEQKIQAVKNQRDRVLNKLGALARAAPGAADAARVAELALARLEEACTSLESFIRARRSREPGE